MIIFCSGSLWVGASDINVEGVVQWLDGSVFDLSHQWGQSQPDGGKRANCFTQTVSDNTTMDLADESCDHLYGYMCQSYTGIE